MGTIRRLQQLRLLCRRVTLEPTRHKNAGKDAGATDSDFDDLFDQQGNAEAAAPIDLGPNNERLEDANPKVVHALRELVRQYREEGIVARRNEIRRIRQARLFWQGLQYAWWNPNDMNWHLPYENRSSDDRQLEDMPRYQFVTNFYQGFGLSFVAVLSQDVPSVNNAISPNRSPRPQKGCRTLQLFRRVRFFPNTSSIDPSKYET